MIIAAAYRQGIFVPLLLLLFYFLGGRCIGGVGPYMVVPKAYVLYVQYSRVVLWIKTRSEMCKEAS